MLQYPGFDPVAFEIGSFGVRWYGLMYLAGFLTAYGLGHWRIRRNPLGPVNKVVLEDLLFFVVLGVVLGGRLGHVVFYEPAYYFSHPLEIFMVWKGGMSFHGGLLGVLVGIWHVARKYRLRWLMLTDFVAPLIPLALGFGRLGNFINGELVGRVTDVPWGMVFPQYGNEPRHPSQLYEFGLEGIALFFILWLYSARPRRLGAVSALFLICYGSFRFLVEFVRSPEDGFVGPLTAGQALTLPMLLIGVAMFFWSRRQSVAHAQ